MEIQKAQATLRAKAAASRARSERYEVQNGRMANAALNREAERGTRRQVPSGSTAKVSKARMFVDAEAAARRGELKPRPEADRPSSFGRCGKPGSVRRSWEEGGGLKQIVELSCGGREPRRQMAYARNLDTGRCLGPRRSRNIKFGKIWSGGRRSERQKRTATSSAAWPESMPPC